MRRGWQFGALELTPEDVCDSEFAEAVAGPYRSKRDQQRDALLACCVRLVGNAITLWMVATCGFMAGYAFGYVEGVPAGLLMSVAQWVNAK